MHQILVILKFGCLYSQVWRFDVNTVPYRVQDLDGVRKLMTLMMLVYDHLK